MDNCCDSMLNKLVAIFNFFLFLIGAILIGVGTYIHVQMSDYLNYFDDSYVNASVLFIVLGAIVLILGFFGCCGACTENSCMMFTFATLLALVVIAEVGAAIAVYVFRGEVNTIVTNKMNEGLNNYEQGEQYKGVTDTWNAVQSDFHCCGVSNYSNWKGTPFGNKDNGVPDTCCKTAEKGCGKGMFGEGADLDKINQSGCVQLLEEFVVDKVAVIGGIGIGIALLQIVGVLVSCMLAGSMRRRSASVDMRSQLHMLDSRFR